MSKCIFNNLILSRQIWSFCPWLPRKPANYYALASALGMQLLKIFYYNISFIFLKLVFIERTGLTALANEIVCLPTEYVLPRQWQSKLPHAVLSVCYNFSAGGWREEELEEEVGSLYHQVFATKMCKLFQENDLSSTENSTAKNWVKSSSGNLYAVCKPSSGSQPWSCCCVALGINDRWCSELSRVFHAQRRGKRIFKEFWCWSLQQKILGWYLQIRGESGKSGHLR